MAAAAAAAAAAGGSSDDDDGSPPTSITATVAATTAVREASTEFRSAFVVGAAKSEEAMSPVRRLSYDDGPGRNNLHPLSLSSADADDAAATATAAAAAAVTATAPTTAATAGQVLVSLTPTPSLAGSPRDSSQLRLSDQLQPFPDRLATAPMTVGEDITLLRHQVFVAETEVAAAAVRKHAMEEEGQPAGDQLAATCFGHWKAKVRAEVMMRGPGRAKPLLAVQLRRTLQLRGLAEGKRFVRTKMQGVVQRRMGDGVLMAWLTRVIFERLRGLAASSRADRRLGELVAIKRSLRWWNLWTVVRLRNRAEDLLARCETYHRHRRLRGALARVQFSAATRRLRLASFGAADGHARLGGLREGLRGLVRYRALRRASKAVASRDRTQRLRCVFEQVATVRRRSTALQAKLLEEHATRRHGRMLRAWAAWSERRARAHRAGQLLATQCLRRSKLGTLKHWFDTFVAVERRRLAAQLMQRHVRGRLSRAAVREVRRAEAKERAGLLADIYFVRWHGRHSLRRVLAEREAVATEAMQRLRARRVLRRLNDRIRDSALVMAAAEHEDETIELRRGDALQVWHAFARRCAAHRARRRRRDAMVRRWHLRRALVELYEAAMRARREGAAAAMGAAAARRRGLALWASTTDEAFASEDRRALGASHYRRRVLSEGVQQWLERAAASASERERVEPFLLRRRQRRGFERLMDVWAAARQQNRRRADAFARERLHSSGLAALAIHLDASRASAARLAEGARHFERRGRRTAFRAMVGHWRGRAAAQARARDADRLAHRCGQSRAVACLVEHGALRAERRQRIAVAAAFYRDGSMLPRCFRRFKRMTRRPVSREAAAAHGARGMLRRGLGDWADAVDRRAFLREAYRSIRDRNARFFVFLGALRRWQRWIRYQASLVRRSLAVSDAARRSNRRRTLERWRYLVFGEGQIVLRAMALREAATENRKGAAWDAWVAAQRARREGRGAVVLQKTARRWLATILRATALEAAVVIQCALRSATARGFVDSAIDAAELIQCWARCVIAKRGTNERRRALVRVQGGVRIFQAYRRVVLDLSYQLPLADIEALTAAYAAALEALRSLSNAIEMWRGSEVVFGRFHMPPSMIMGAMVSRCHDWPQAIRHLFYTQRLPLRLRVLRFFQRVVGEALRRLRSIAAMSKAELLDRSTCAIAHTHWCRRAERRAVATLRTKVLVRRAAAWCLQHTSWQPPLAECFDALVAEWKAGLKRDRRPGEVYHQRRVWTRWSRWVARQRQLRAHAAQVEQATLEKHKARWLGVWRRRAAKRAGAGRLAVAWVRAWARYQLHEWWMAGKLRRWAVRSVARVWDRWLTAFYSDLRYDRLEADGVAVQSALRRWYRQGVERTVVRERGATALREKHRTASRRSLRRWHFFAVSSRRSKDSPSQKGGVWLARRAK